MNSFFGIGFMELAFIAILALIVLGPERLPKAARDVAKAYQQVRGLSSELTAQFSEELKVLEELNPQKLMNDLTQDVVNPPKKKPQPKTAAKPLASKKPAETETSEDPKSVGVGNDAEVFADGEAAAIVDTDPTEENQILPPSPEAAVADEEAPPARDDAAVDDTETSAHQQTDDSA